MKIGFLFPGQGSQTIGMGKDLYEEYETVRNTYQKVKEITGMDIAKITFDETEEELNQTKNTQICILTMSLAITEILKQHGIHEQVSAGLSLGEYSALITSGAISFEEGVKLVQKRGEYMQNLAPKGEWMMAAILGMTEEQVEKICQQVKNGFAVPVNFNCPGQIVISGDKEGVEETENIAKEMGAKKVRILKTSGPFHTEKLTEASQALRKELEKIKIMPFKSKVRKNIDGTPYTENDDIKDILAKHIISPVRFTKTLQTMLDMGIDTFVEIGPGKTLSGFVKRMETDKELKILNINDIETLNNALSILK